MEIGAQPNQSFIFDPPTRGRDVLRYGLAMMAVVAIFVGLLLVWDHPIRPPEDAALASEAIMVDLSPAEAPPAQGEGGLDNQAQEASSASIGQVAPPAEEPPKPDEPEKPVELPPPPPVPDPAAVLERQDKIPPKPRVAAAPPQAARKALVRTGSDAKTKTDTDADDEAVPHASARVFLLWQKQMIERLAIARRFLPPASRSNGTAKVAFSIDRRGRLISARVARSSGDAALDGAALTLVKRAAPFPPPPSGATRKDMMFVVPIRFRRT